MSLRSPMNRGIHPPFEKPSLKPDEEAALERLAKIIKQKLIESKLSKTLSFRKGKKRSPPTRKMELPSY